MRLLALDPGVSTGWSMWAYSTRRQLTHVQHGTVKDGLRGFLAWQSVNDFDEVVIEDFILDGRTRQPDTTPLEIIGAVEALTRLAGVRLTRQRNVMKVHAPDTLLKAKNLWWPGAGHDRDSARHAIARMKILKHQPTLRWLYGREHE